MSPERENHIVKSYPAFFPDFRGDESKTCLAFGLAIDDGWANLFETLCNDIHALNPSDFYWTQVKEKFGGLRAYYSGGDEQISKLVQEAEDRSYKICELCGSQNEVSATGRGWIKTLCSKCRHEK